jgi:non-ribosomal peptide synthetase component F
MLSKNTIIQKVFENSVGGYEIAYNNNLEKTKPYLNNLKNKSKDINELIELILNSKIMQLRISINNNLWNITQESFLSFVQNNTSCNFAFESLNDYIAKFNNNNSQNPFLIEFVELSDEQKQEIKQWLLN